MPIPDAALNSARSLVNTLACALQAELIETHISWVLLAADTAYKIKKPVHLPFIDYSTLQARQHFCEEEVRLNQRLAPTLYLGVTRITGTPTSPELDSAGPVLEYAVRMRRFSPGALFSERIAAGVLDNQDMDQLAALLANFHENAPRAATADGFSGAGQRRRVALAALEGTRSFASDAALSALQAWLVTEAIALAPLWTSRQADGHVRECHGDLHLSNLVRLDEHIAAFDCIEFDPALRWIDVLDDAAFVVMDLAAHHRQDLCSRFLNAWLDRIGDHAALPALRFSVIYRALVRAQVEHLRSAGSDAVHRYLSTALAWSQPGKARLTIMHGLPGSGKTHVSQNLLEQEGAIRLRSDVERKRLHGLGMLEDSRARGLDLYGSDTTARTYAQLFSLARIALQAGYPVILDAAFPHRSERDQAHALARNLGVPFSIVHCEAPLPVLRQRLLSRRGDASEATPVVLDQLLPDVEALADDELPFLRAPTPHPTA